LGRRYDKIRSMYYFLLTREQRQEPFTLEQMAEATGYKLSSILTYHGKRLKDVLVHERPDGHYLARGLVGVFDERGFIDLMADRLSAAGAADLDEPDEPDEPQPPDEQTWSAALVDTLLLRAQSACEAALTLYHLPGIQPRMALATPLVLQAWECLLKAEIVRLRGLEQICYLSDPLRGLSARDTITRLFAEEHDPVRRNLEWLLRLQNESAHLLLIELQPFLVRLLQAALLNFRRRFEAVAGRRLLTVGAGRLDLTDAHNLIPPDQLALRYGEPLARQALALLTRLLEDERAMASEAFISPAGLRVALVRDGADLLELTPRERR
jgi:hypothetical protein